MCSDPDRCALNMCYDYKSYAFFMTQMVVKVVKGPMFCVIHLVPSDKFRLIHVLRSCFRVSPPQPDLDLSVTTVQPATTKQYGFTPVIKQRRHTHIKMMDITSRMHEVTPII